MSVSEVDLIGAKKDDKKRAPMIRQSNEKLLRNHVASADCMGESNLEETLKQNTLTISVIDRARQSKGKAGR